MANGFKLADAYVEVRGDGTKIPTDIGRVVNGMGNIGHNLGRKLALGITGAVAAVGIGKFIADTIKDGVESQALDRAAKVTFGKLTSTVDKWAKSTANSFGLSHDAALKAATGLQQLFKNFGFTEKAALSASEKMVQLGADLAAYKNLPTEEVMNRITAALRGQTRGINQLLPGITAAKIEQLALAETGKTHAKTLTDQEKATAAFNLIMEKATPLMGYFAKSQDDAGTKIKIAQANIENFKDSLGNALLPIVSFVVDAFNKYLIPVIQAFGSWLDSSGGKIQGFVGVIDSILAPAFKVLSDIWTKTVIPGLSGIFDWFGKNQGIIGGVSDAVTFLGTKIGELASGALNGLWTILKNDIFPVFAGFSGWLSDNKYWIGQLMSAVGNLISTVLSDLWKTLKNTIFPVLQDFGKWLGDNKDKIFLVLDALGKFIGKLVGKDGALDWAFKIVADAWKVALKPALDGLLGALSDAKNLDKVAAFAAAFVGLRVAVQGVSVAMDVLSKHPVAVLISAIVLTVGWMIYAAQHTEELKKKELELADAIIAAWNKIANGTAVVLAGWVANVVGAAGRIGAEMHNLWVTIWNDSTGGWNRIGTSLGTWLSSVILQIQGFAVRLFASWVQAWAALPGQVQTVWNQIVTTISTKIGEIITWITGMPGRMVNALPNMLELLKQKGRDVLQGFLNGLTAVWTSIQKFIEGIAPWIKGAKGPISLDKNLLVGAGSAMMEGFRNGLTAGFTTIQKIVSGMGATLTGNVTKWLPQVQQALAMLGQPASLAGAVLRRIAFESSGNPNAINLTDINAKQGHPSQGLMQTIPSTFRAYAGSLAGRGITDPLANIYAGLNYALHRYGSIGAIDPLNRPYGYDRGGMLPTGLTLAYNGTGRPEAITPWGAGGTTINIASITLDASSVDTMQKAIQTLTGLAQTARMGRGLSVGVGRRK